MKICTKCKNNKADILFARRSSATDGLSSWCKECFAKNAHIKYQGDATERARKAGNRAATTKRNRDFIWNYLLDHPCIDCSNKDPRVLEFDHKDAADKVKEVSLLIEWGSLKKIQSEIDRCDVRCANCHRIRTQDQFGTWRSRR